MADAKITALTEMTSPLTTDVMPVVDDPSGTPVTQKITLANLSKVVPFTTVRKTGLDQGAASTSFTNSVNEMDFTLAANSNYIFDYYVRYQTAANTTGLVLGLQTAVAPVGLWMNWYTPLAATGTVTGGGAIGSNSTIMIASGNITTGGVQLAHVHGMVISGASSGTMALRWCSEVSGSLATIKTGTMGRIMLVP